MAWSFGCLGPRCERNVEDRKLIERRYYDRKAQLCAEGEQSQPREPLGAEAMPPLLRSPYVEFERRVRSCIRPGDVVLDVGAGTGIHSLTAGGDQRVLIGVDFSFEAIAVARRRAIARGVRLHVMCADGERLPIASSSVDVVTSAGVLYCVDLTTLVAEIRRILKPTGTWVFVDSYDHNPVYRLNRLVGYMRRRRTKRALTNIPNRQTLAKLRKEFRHVHVSYHGVFSFLGPLLQRVVGEAKAERFLDGLDRVSPRLQEFAFKIVASASEPVAHPE